jgi:Uma2 family endonuclease
MAIREIFIPTEIEYPSSDGEPIAESDFQRKPLTYAVEALGIYFQDRPDVYVSGDLFIYYEEGDPQARVAPDVFVVFGVSKEDRPSYFVWKEGKAPDFVLEITSRSTVSVDQGAKRGIYAYLGVTEYFQYDPTGDYLRPSLRGLQLSGENYISIRSRTTADDTLIVPSEVLGLELRLDDSGLRFYDPASGQKLLSHQEAEMVRLNAEARIAELEAELARLKR